MHAHNFRALHNFRFVLPFEHGSVRVDERVRDGDQYELCAVGGRGGGEGDQWIYDEFSIDVGNFGRMFSGTRFCAFGRMSLFFI